MNKMIFDILLICGAVFLFFGIMGGVIFKKGGGMDNIFGPLYPWGRWDLKIISAKKTAALSKSKRERITANALVYSLVSFIVASLLIAVAFSLRQNL